MPGVVRVLQAEDAKTNISEDQVVVSTAEPSGEDERKHRVKKRIVLGSRGTELLRAKSVKDLLMAVYDVLEGILSLKQNHIRAWY